LFLSAKIIEEKWMSDKGHLNSFGGRSRKNGEFSGRFFCESKGKNMLGEMRN
jgi:hypothetical protein